MILQVLPQVVGLKVIVRITKEITLRLINIYKQPRLPSEKTVIGKFL